MKTNIKFYKESNLSDSYEYIFETYMTFPVVPEVGTEVFLQGQNFCVTYVKFIYESNYCEIHIIVEEIDG